MENENLIYLINKRNEIIEKQKELEKSSILIGMNPKYNEDGYYQETLHPDVVKEEYNENNNLLQEIIEAIRSKDLDIKPEEYRLSRKKLISFINSKYDYRKDDISKLTTNVLEDILEELKRYLYENDNRFNIAGRRSELEKEIENNISNNNLLEAFCGFYEYIETGDEKICKQEKDKIILMINKIKDYMDVTEILNLL